jgi:hypothetical protein
VRATGSGSLARFRTVARAQFERLGAGPFTDSEQVPESARLLLEKTSELKDQGPGLPALLQEYEPPVPLLRFSESGWDYDGRAWRLRYFAEAPSPDGARILYLVADSEFEQGRRLATFLVAIQEGRGSFRFSPQFRGAEGFSCSVRVSR